MFADGLVCKHDKNCMLLKKFKILYIYHSKPLPCVFICNVHYELDKSIYKQFLIKFALPKKD